MELDIVMLNAHKISSSLMARPTVKDGNHQSLIQTPEPVNMDPAALRWISGKQIKSRRHTLLILAPCKNKRDVQDLNAVPVQTDTRVSVIKMVAI